MELFNLWLLIHWDAGEEGREQTHSERVTSAARRLVLSTAYWMAVAASLTVIVSHLA